MLKEWVIFVNDKKVEDINYVLNLGDILKIKLPNGQDYVEEITKFPKYQPVIVVFNKPKWYVVSKEDKFNKTIFDILPKSWRKDFYYIWRLDKNSHGLLLLTNEPEIVDYYTNPKNKIPKIYIVKIDKPLKTNDKAKLLKWIFVDEQGNYFDENKLKKINQWANIEIKGRLDKLKFDSLSYFKDKNWHFLKIVLKEWKKRHIRRSLKALGYKVFDLKRIKFWKYQLDNIKPGKWRVYKIK